MVHFLKESLEPNPEVTGAACFFTNTECGYPETKCNQNDWDYKLCYTLHLIRTYFFNNVGKIWHNWGQKVGTFMPLWGAWGWEW